MPQQGPVRDDSGGPVRRADVDLGLALDRSSTRALPDQLEHALREMVACGELPAGTRLPSTRSLAAQLAVSRGVVVEAYDRLQRQGVLTTRQGAAVRVAEGVDGPPRGASEAPALPAHDPYTLRLHPALVPPATFDRRAWRGLLRRALEEVSDDALRSTSHLGLPELRTAVVAQLARSRGVIAQPERVVVTSGVTHALQLLAPLLRGRGPVAVEEPGFLLHRATLAGAACELRPVPVDRDGIDVDALARSDARTVLLTPAHQMPLGYPLAADRRRELLRWARDTDALIVEDDYDGELRYDRQSVRALQALDPERVIYLGTTSKVLSPALRIGWIVAPSSQLAGIHLLATIAGATPGTLDQAALALALSTGAFDRSVARLRRRCTAQRQAMNAALAAALPHLRREGVEAGLTLTLRAPGLQASQVMACAELQRVELFAVQSGDDALVIVGFGDVHESRATDAAERVAAILQAAAQS
jgi:GntR family transcriptional regulator / MocR family aminotransferase